MVDENEVQPEVAEVKEVVKEAEPQVVADEDPVAATADPAPDVAAVHPAKTIMERIEADIDSLKSSPHALCEWVKGLIAEAKAKL